MQSDTILIWYWTHSRRLLVTTVNLLLNKIFEIPRSIVGCNFSNGCNRDSTHLISAEHVDKLSSVDSSKLLETLKLEVSKLEANAGTRFEISLPKVNIHTFICSLQGDGIFTSDKA